MWGLFSLYQWWVGDFNQDKLSNNLIKACLFRYYCKFTVKLFLNFFYVHSFYHLKLEYRLCLKVYCIPMLVFSFMFEFCLVCIQTSVFRKMVTIYTRSVWTGNTFVTHPAIKLTYFIFLTKVVQIYTISFRTFCFI